MQFVNGVRLVESKLLTAIKLWAPNPTTTAVVRSYQLTYSVSEVSSRSLLETVRECDEGISPAICMPAVEFKYDRGDHEDAPECFA